MDVCVWWVGGGGGEESALGKMAIDVDLDRGDVSILGHDSGCGLG